MARNAGVISINLNAGTAKLMTDMDSAAAKVRDFGGHTTSSMAASSAAIRELEGALPIRAVERFLTSVLGLGPALQAAFPVVGAVAFAGVIGETGKLYEFFKDIQEAPERIAGAFRELNAPLRLTNDQLAVANDRLANDIAKLEGHHQNTLKLALDEARVAADNLAASLDRDLSALNKVLQDNTHNAFMARIRGQVTTNDIQKELGGETGFGGFTGVIAGITDEGIAKIRQAGELTDKVAASKAKEAAQTELNTRLVKAYGDEITKLSGQLESAQRHQAIRQNDLANGMPSFIGLDQTVRIEDLTKTIRTLQERRNSCR